jgi:hypothetical protein
MIPDRLGKALWARRHVLCLPGRFRKAAFYVSILSRAMGFGLTSKKAASKPSLILHCFTKVAVWFHSECFLVEAFSGGTGVPTCSCPPLKMGRVSRNAPQHPKKVSLAIKILRHARASGAATQSRRLQPHQAALVSIE